MLRISKLTDYAVVLTTRLAASPDETLAVTELAAQTGVPEPTARKVLKQLGRARLLTTCRGAQGGYRLAHSPEDTSVLAVITAMEGPVAVTECASEDTAGSCAHEGRCDVQGNWQRINIAIETALRSITMADMVSTPGSSLVSLGLRPPRRAGTPELTGGPDGAAPLSEER